MDHMKTIYDTDEAPSPIGPYSQAVKMHEVLYTSGQIALNPITNQMVQTSIEAETFQVMKNLEALLSAADLNWDHVVKATIYLTNMADFPKVNEVYGTVFKQSYPARETVQVVALPRGANVEISLIASK
jgi:2-iminobutanoate/2-iminopropanoate deaminase